MALPTSSHPEETHRHPVVEAIERSLRASRDGSWGFADALRKTLRVLEYRAADARAPPHGPPSPASLLLSFEVSPNLCNDYRTLHGGAQATAIDAFTSMLLAVVHRVPSVTADLHVSCVGPAPLGSTVYCLCRAEKHGGALQFASCDLYRIVEEDETNETNEQRTTQPPPKPKSRKVLVAKGLHTKYVLKKRILGFDGKQPQPPTQQPPRSKL